MTTEAAKPDDAPPPPKPAVYTLSPRAEELQKAFAPLREWRQRNYPGANPPPDVKSLCEKIDAVAAEVRGYLGAWLEPFPI